MDTVILAFMRELLWRRVVEMRSGGAGVKEGEDTVAEGVVARLSIQTREDT